MNELLGWLLNTLICPFQQTSSLQRIRCVRPGMGEPLVHPTEIQRGESGQSGANPPYQLQGASGSVVRSSVLCQEHEECPCPAEDRQYCGGGICQQNGGTPSRDLCMSVSTQDMELVLGLQRNNLSRAPARFSESDGALGVKSQTRLVQMGTRHEYISAVDGEERSIHNRLIHIPTISKTPSLLQLEVRPRSNSSECLVPALGSRERICLLSLAFCLIG